MLLFTAILTAGLIYILIQPAGNAQTIYFKLKDTQIVTGFVPEIQYTKIPDPLIPTGGKDACDAVDVLNPSVVQKDGVYYNYYSGYDGEAWRTGLATSKDGIAWEKEETPVIDLSPAGWDSAYIAANGSAIRVENSVYYYYQGLNKDTKKTRIGLAVSADGYSFAKENQPVLTAGGLEAWDASTVGDPYVLLHNGCFYMYYLGVDFNKNQRIGIAMSRDGKTWTKHSENPILDLGVTGSFDEKALGEPCVFYRYPFFYMLYTGTAADNTRDIGCAYSIDGINWKKLNSDGIFAGRDPDAWDGAVICDPAVLTAPEGDRVTVWYGGGSAAEAAQDLNGQIGMFTMKLLNGWRSDTFDPNTFETISTLPLSLVLHGAYRLEGEDSKKFCWVKPQAQVELYRSKDAVTVRGYLPAKSHLKANQHKDVVTLTFTINGEPANRLTLKENEKFTQKIDLGHINEGDSYVLEIKTETGFKPSDIGDSGDSRELSFQLYYIG